jgi:hypothetical protein
MQTQVGAYLIGGTGIEVSTAGVQGRFMQNFFPVNRGGFPIIYDCIRRQKGGFYGSMGRVIAKEKVGVYVKATEDTWRGQLYYTPVMTGGALSATFPAVHPFAPIGVFAFYKNAPSGLNEVFFFCKEVIGGVQYLTSKACGSQVGVLCEIGDSLDNFFYAGVGHVFSGRFTGESFAQR